MTSQFSVRNPEHEFAAARRSSARSPGKPVTLSHHLSARAQRTQARRHGGAQRAPHLDHRRPGAHHRSDALVERGVHAPLMVVRGDGSLVSAAFVRERPIETILCGPAASLVGAAHLTGLTDAIISDIGGTTTDIAVLRDGIPAVSPDGATVGGHQTMVSAVAMHTHGLGGDSRVRHDERAAGACCRSGRARWCRCASSPSTSRSWCTTCSTSSSPTRCPAELDGMVLIAERYDERLAALDGIEHAGAGGDGWPRRRRRRRRSPRCSCSG